MKRFGLCLAASVALVSCGDEAAQVEERNEDATARGEVLGGTISDDMLPLDTVTSQSPPLQAQENGENDESASDGSAEVAAEPAASAETEAEAAPEPATGPAVEE